MALTGQMLRRIPSPQLALVCLLVDDYDRAIDYFTGTLGFRLEEDSPLSEGKRWVVVSPGGSGTHLLLARATGERQRAAIGDQTGGRVFLFLQTWSFDEDHARLVSAGVNFTERPRQEPYGRVAVFEDVFGNRWDLVEWRAGYADRQEG